MQHDNNYYALVIITYKFVKLDYSLLQQNIFGKQNSCITYTRNENWEFHFFKQWA